MGIMVYSSLCVMQDLYHQPYGLYNRVLFKGSRAFCKKVPSKGDYRALYFHKARSVIGPPFKVL